MERGLRVRQFTAGSCYSYILESRSESIIIDPHVSLRNEYLRYLRKNKLVLKYIVDTHTHADHFSLAASLKKEFNTPVVMHERAVSEVADSRIGDNSELVIGSAKIKAIYTPGHTDDAISLYGEGRLFSGDVLLIESIGRTDFQNGSPEAMFDTLQRLKSLPEKTLLFPGHDYRERHSSILFREKKKNPYFKETDKGNFTHHVRSKVAPKPFNIDNIIRANQKGEAESLMAVTAAEAYALARDDPRVKLLDVRSHPEYSEVHIKGAINMPIDTLAAKIEELGVPRESYIVFCRTGSRSPLAADMLIRAGFPSVKIMEGGIKAWQKGKLPVIKGQGSISLERQIRFIGGSLILLGILMTMLLRGEFILISIFVAFSLVYSGLTDNCFLRVILMKLPYNKKQYKVQTEGATCSIS